MNDRDPISAPRRRGGAPVWLGLLGLGLAAAATLALLQLAGPSTRFWTVGRLAVSGNRTLPADELLAAAGLRTGDAWWSVPRDADLRLLAAHSRVAAAEIRWVAPRGLELRIQERDVLLRLGAPIDGMNCDLSSDGVLLETHPVFDPIDLPVLTGDFPGQLRPGSRIESVLDASWVAHFASVRDRSPELWRAISEVRYLGEEGFAVYLRPGHRVVLWDPSINGELWAHLPRILEDLDGWGIDDAVLELRFRDQVVVRPAPGQMPPTEDTGASDEENAA